MAAKIHSLILWQSTRSGNWVCEIHDVNTGGFVGIGLGLTKQTAQDRALFVAERGNVKLPMLPRALSLCHA